MKTRDYMVGCGNIILLPIFISVVETPKGKKNFWKRSTGLYLQYRKAGEQAYSGGNLPFREEVPGVFLMKKAKYYR